MKPTPIVVIQGAQWGSEAKGAIAAKVCLDRDITWAVRTGAINAGHTVVYNGQHYAMQQIPTGWVNPHTQLIIGAGAYIHPDTLWREIDMINVAMPDQDVRNRLYVDFRCGIHDEGAESASKEANRHHSIGATGKGCSEAIVAKIRNRNAGYKLFSESERSRVFRNHGLRFSDTVAMLHFAYDRGESILIEGTQGTLLDLHLGPYPFTTSRMTTAANWIAEAGLAPGMEYETIMVVRTYPIRVAGNSGPMSNEIEWVDLARSINTKRADSNMAQLVRESSLVEFEAALSNAATQAVIHERYKVPHDGRAFNTRLSGWSAGDRDIYRVAASELHRDALQLMSTEGVQDLRNLFEMTTVTRKLRRIARISYTDLVWAIQVNRPSSIALTFLDYEVPQLAGVRWGALDSSHTEAASIAMQYIDELEKAIKCKVSMASTGPTPSHVIPVELLEKTAGRVWL